MKTARCWNCNFTLRLPDHKSSPKKCPLCGYGNSKADQDAYYLKVARAKKWAMRKANWFGLKDWMVRSWNWIMSFKKKNTETRSITIDTLSFGKSNKPRVVINWLCKECKSPLKKYTSTASGMRFVDKVSSEKCSLCLNFENKKSSVFDWTMGV